MSFTDSVRVSLSRIKGKEMPYGGSRYNEDLKKGGGACDRRAYKLTSSCALLAQLLTQKDIGEAAFYINKAHGSQNLMLPLEASSLIPLRLFLSVFQSVHFCLVVLKVLQR